VQSAHGAVASLSSTSGIFSVHHVGQSMVVCEVSVNLESKLVHGDLLVCHADRLCGHCHVLPHGLGCCQTHETLPQKCPPLGCIPALLLSLHFLSLARSFWARWRPFDKMGSSLAGFSYSDTIFMGREHVWTLALDRLQYLLESFILCCHSLCKLNT